MTGTHTATAHLVEMGGCIISNPYDLPYTVNNPEGMAGL